MADCKQNRNAKELIQKPSKMKFKQTLWVEYTFKPIPKDECSTTSPQKYDIQEHKSYVGQLRRCTMESKNAKHLNQKPKIKKTKDQVETPSAVHASKEEQCSKIIQPTNGLQRQQGQCITRDRKLSLEYILN